MGKNGEQNKTGHYSKDELDAMKQRAKELKNEAKANKKKEEGEKDIKDAIAKMNKSDKEMAEKLHEIVYKVYPDVWPKTWYGFPAYTKEKDGNVIVFFQAASRFDTRYATLGFNDGAKLDDGNMWPASYAVQKITAAEEKKITELVTKAMS